MLLLAVACSDKGVAVYNTAPTVTIVSPQSGTGVDPGDLVEFIGLANDHQTDPAELTVLWSSSLDGDLDDTPPDVDGDLYFASSALSPGTHTITLSAFDSIGEAGSAAIEVQVGEGGGGT